MGLNIRIRELGFEFMRLMDGLIVVSAASIETHYYAEVGCAIDLVLLLDLLLELDPPPTTLRRVGGMDASGTSTCASTGGPYYL